MVIAADVQKQLTSIQVELSDFDERLEFAERRTQAIRHQNFVDNFLSGLTDFSTEGFIGSHLDWKHVASPSNPESGFQRLFADTDNSGHITSRNSSGTEIDLEYTDADAIAAVEGEATLSLTGDVKVVSGGKFFEAADFRLDSATELTIDGSGDIAITQSYHRVDTASDGATDNLDGMSGGNDGAILIIRPENDARTVVVRHNQNAANAKNILLADATNATLDDISDYIMLIYDVNLDTNGAWIEIGRSTGSSIYTDAKAIAAVEGEDPLNLAGDVFIADLKGLVIGHTAQIDFGAIPEFQVLGTATPDSSMGFARFENNASGPDVRFLKSRGATIGSNVIVQDGDTLGRIRFQGADTVDFNTTAAEILGKVDGAPASNDIPGSIVFRTRVSGGSLADRMTLDDAGNLILLNDLVMADEKFIRMGTADAADNESTGIAGGGSLSSIRGSFVRVSGNEDANTGKLFLTAGNVSGGEIRLSTGGSQRMVVDDAGLVGIGLSSPLKNLHISSTVPTIRLSDSDAGTDQAVATLIEFYRGDNTNRVGFLGMGSASNDILVIGTDYTAGEIRFATGSNTLAVTISSSQATTFAGLITGDLGLTISGADFSLDGDLDFVGPQSITTSTGDLTISPSGNVGITKNVALTGTGGGLVQNTTGLGLKVAAFGTTYGLGIQSNLLEFITATGNADFRWGHGTSGSLTELMFLNSGTGQLQLPLGGSGAGLLIGTDVQLFRGSANRLDLASGDSFNIVSGSLFLANIGSGVNAITIRASADADDRFRIRRNKLMWGDGTNTPDIDLSRGAASRLDLASGDSFRIATDGSTGALQFGASGDAQLFRGAANRLDLASGDSFNIVAGDLTVGSSLQLFGAQAKIIIDGGDATFTTTNIGIAESGGVLFLQSRGSISFLIDSDDNATTQTFKVTKNENLGGAAGTLLFELNESGQLKLPQTTSAGIVLGGDVHLFRGAANRLDLASGDSLEIVSGNINIGGDLTLTGTVDGVDIAARDHAKYTDAEAISAVEGEATLVLAGEVSIASGKDLSMLTDGSGGGVKFGASSDVLLFRGAANRLDLADGDAFLTEISEVNRDVEATGHESKKHVITSLGGMLNFGQVGYFTIRSTGESFLGLWADGSVDNPGSGARGTDTEGRRGTIATGTTSGEEAFFDSVDLHQGDNNPMMMFKFRLDQTTDVQVFAGFTSLGAANAVGSDSPGSHLGLSYSTVRGDSNWQFISGDGLSQNVTDSGIAVDTGAHYIYVYFDQASGEGQVELFNSSHVFQAGARFTTNLPAAANEMRVAVGLETQTTTNKTMALYYGQGVNRV